MINIALKLYLDSSFTDEVSQETNINPDICHGSGTTGFVSKRQLWIKNDDIVKYYEDIIITAVNDTSDISVTYSSTENGTYTDNLSLDDIGTYGEEDDSTTFWRKATISKGVSQQNKTDIVYRITATECDV